MIGFTHRSYLICLHVLPARVRSTASAANGYGLVLGHHGPVSTTMDHHITFRIDSECRPICIIKSYQDIALYSDVYRPS